MYPLDASGAPAQPLRGTWKGSQESFTLRARESGHLHAQTLCWEALGQVRLGRHDNPLPIDAKGNVATIENGVVNIVLRFGVDQAGKLRACDDIRRNRANLHCEVRGPIELPKWEHIFQMRVKVKTSERKRAFVKEGREESYNQLPLEPSNARVAMVFIRNPATSVWMAFPPKALLLGDVAAALRYNCFAGYCRPSPTSFSVYHL